MQSFFCELCSKGYTRQNEYDVHLSSYDHAHRQRLKDMKAMTRVPQASARARRAEAPADDIVPIVDATGSGGPRKGGFKKTGFKSAFAPVGPVGGGHVESAPVTATVTTNEPGRDGSGIQRDSVPKDGTDGDDDIESDSDYDYELYDPSRPTD